MSTKKHDEEGPSKSTKGCSWSEQLSQYVREAEADSRIRKAPDIYKKAGISRQSWSRMISNSDYHPSKDTVMSIAKALSLSVGQLKDMLESAGYSSQDIRQNGLKTNFDKGAWKFAQSIASLRNTEDLLSDTSASPDGKRQRLVQELATTYTKETTIRIIEESLSLSLSDISFYLTENLEEQFGMKKDTTMMRRIPFCSPSLTLCIPLHANIPPLNIIKKQTKCSLSLLSCSAARPVKQP